MRAVVSVIILLAFLVGAPGGVRTRFDDHAQLSSLVACDDVPDHTGGVALAARVFTPPCRCAIVVDVAVDTVPIPTHLRSILAHAPKTSPPKTHVSS